MLSSQIYCFRDSVTLNRVPVMLFCDLQQRDCPGFSPDSLLSSSRQSVPAQHQFCANVAELLMNPKGAFITGADFLIDGGATASYFYGPLKPEE